MKLRFFLALIFLIGCQSVKNKLNLNIEVEGLKKGTIVLKKLNDSLFIEIDSFTVKGDDMINFTYDLKEPEMLFLDLNLNDGSEIKSLNFFAEKAEINIKTSLDNYGFNIDVKGSKNDSLFRDYLFLNKKFNNEKLNLFEMSFKNSKLNYKDSLKVIEDEIININKRQFLHNANFAVRNSSSEIAPYIAITDLIESKKILDTVYKSLSETVKKSKYGVELKTLID